MVKTFRSKALKALWEDGEVKKLPPESIKKMIKILNYIDGMNNISDLADSVIRQYRVHTLKKSPYNDFWSMDVTGNFRVVFRLENGDAYDIDYLDTH